MRERTRVISTKHAVSKGCTVRRLSEKKNKNRNKEEQARDAPVSRDGAYRKYLKASLTYHTYCRPHILTPLEDGPHGASTARVEENGGCNGNKPSQRKKGTAKVSIQNKDIFFCCREKWPRRGMLHAALRRGPAAYNKCFCSL